MSKDKKVTSLAKEMCKLSKKGKNSRKELEFESILSQIKSSASRGLTQIAFQDAVIERSFGDDEIQKSSSLDFLESHKPYVDKLKKMGFDVIITDKVFLMSVWVDTEVEEKHWTNPFRTYKVKKSEKVNNKSVTLRKLVIKWCCGKKEDAHVTPKV